MSVSPPNTKERRGILAWIILHPKTSLTVAAVLLMIGLTLLFHRAAEGRLQRRIAAIRAKGEPVTIEDLEARIPKIPDEENAATVLSWHHGQLTQIAYPPIGPLVPYWGTARLPTLGERLRDDLLDAMQQLMSIVQPDLEQVRTAVRTLQGHVQPNLVAPAIRVILPELSEVRYIGRIMMVDATLSAHEGRGGEAVDKLLDVSRAGDILRNQPFLISYLLNMAMYAMVVEASERFVNLDILDEPLLAALHREAQRLETAVNLKEAMMGERIVFLDTMQWMRANKLVAGLAGVAGGPAAGGMNAWAYLPILPVEEIIFGLDATTLAIDAIDQPDFETLDRIAAVGVMVNAQPPYIIIARMLLPSYDRAYFLWARHAASARVMQAALACERFRLASGRWPESLDELVPKYLQVVPLDPFDKQPLRYAVTPDGAKVWSIDENRRDDGGDINWWDGPQQKYKCLDRGWTLLNPELRNRPASPSEPNEN